MQTEGKLNQKANELFLKNTPTYSQTKTYTHTHTYLYIIN